MKKIKKIIAIIIIINTIILALNQMVFAVSNNDILRKEEYSEEYLKWLELPEEERKNTLEPRMYKIDSSNVTVGYSNPLRRALVAEANLESEYRLDNQNNEINIEIKDQRPGEYCWSYAALSSLETNLKKTGKASHNYSEKHMAYSCSTDYSDYNRDGNSGGNWQIAEEYLTNGQGAVIEGEGGKIAKSDGSGDTKTLTVEDKAYFGSNNKADTRVYDTIYFPDYNESNNSSDIIKKVKTHIKTYGAVYATINDGYLDKTGTETINGKNVYCNDGLVSENHAVSIIGWNDNYDKSNFKIQPNNNGAWIVRNSWGTGAGENGYIYVSYEDKLISKNLNGIIKADTELKYDYIYQNSEVFPNSMLKYSNIGKLYLCNIFDKKDNMKDITAISLTALQKCTCKVYIKEIEDEINLTKVQNDDMYSMELTDIGDVLSTKTIEPGYHTIELENTRSISTDKFAVIISIETDENYIDIAAVQNIIANTDGNDSNPLKETLKISATKCFYSARK